jgi:hypothetical protein
MTDSQHYLYIRRWIACVRVNHWVMRKGRLVDEARGLRSEDRSQISEWHEMVWMAAEQLALQQHRAVTVEDLRKGCHVVAFGSAKSSKILDNKEFNRLLVLWGNDRPLHDGGMAGLLIDPLDLASIAAWRNPEITEHNSFVAFLRSKAHEGILIRIAENAFPEVRTQKKSWDELDLSKLRWMSKELKDRRSEVGGRRSENI